MYVFILWFKEAFQGLIKNFFWNIVVVFLSFLSLSAFIVTVISSSNLNSLTNNLNERLEIQVNIKEDYKDYNKYKYEIESLPYVREVTFVSADEALERFKKEVGEDYSVLEIFDGSNPLNAEFIVKVTDTNYIENVAKNIENMSFASEIFYGKEYIERILDVTKYINKISLIVTNIATFFVLVILFFTIKMNIEKRKEEMRIKYLIGSSFLTVRMPFFIETLFLTGFGGVASYYFVKWLYDKMLEFVGNGLPYFDLVEFELLDTNILKSLIIYIFALSLFANLLISNKKINKKI